MAGGVAVVGDPETVQVLSHPVRLRVLEVLRAPASPASVARAIGQSRQNVGHHLKELERVGLVERVGERRVGNFMETLYRPVASTLLVSPRMTLGGSDRSDVLAAQVSLERLIALGERLARDTAQLLDRAAFDGETIQSVSLQADVRFHNDANRRCFLDEYSATVASLAKKYGSRTGRPFRVACAAYPTSEGGSGGHKHRPGAGS